MWRQDSAWQSLLQGLRVHAPLSGESCTPGMEAYTQQQHNIAVLHAMMGSWHLYDVSERDVVCSSVQYSMQPQNKQQRNGNVASATSSTLRLPFL